MNSGIVSFFLLSGILAWLIISIGCIILQLSLDKKQNKLSGLILPGGSFIFSIVAAVLRKFFWLDEFIWQTIAQTTILFCGLNIPTVILVTIRWGYPKRLRRNNEIELMRVQDLE